MAGARIGVIGGSGFYSLLDGAESVSIETPYGNPSAKITSGKIGSVDVAFLPRHGVKHEFPPHVIPNLANIWALKSMGVERIIGPSAVGSLQPRVKIGDIVVADQFVNFTKGRRDTFYDGPLTTHISSADPYCQETRKLAISVGEELGLSIHRQGTLVIIEGPRFSTRAESKFFSERGWDIINMTQYPESILARELEMCYLNLSLITDYDVGLQGKSQIKPVSQEEVMRAFSENNDKLKNMIQKLIPKIPTARNCDCVHALDGARQGV
ncbi:MAG: S-methyl-5'-thioadenosine phosphorylase [Nitrososphaerales archaeon]